MKLFTNPIQRAIDKLDADPSVDGWPIWSTKTGRRYYIITEQRMNALLEEAGYEMVVNGFEVVR